MARAKYLHGLVIPWETVLTFLDTLSPWQTLMERSAEKVLAIDGEFRRVAAVAVGTCLTNHEFPESLLRVLKMIRRNKALPFRWHGQVAPDRWREVNTYVVAMQGWLAMRAPKGVAMDFGVPPEVVGRVYDYLGTERTAVKVAMVRRFMYYVVRHLATTTNLTIIGDEDEVRQRELRYQDFTAAWRDDGIEYQSLDPNDKRVRDLNEIIQSAGASGDAFLNYVLRDSTPACHQRMLRYHDIALYRIGREWTEPEARPTGQMSGDEYRRQFELHIDVLARWHDGRPSPSEARSREISSRVRQTLGEPDDRKRALLDCFTFRSGPATDLQEAAYNWLRANSHAPLMAAAS